MYAESYNMEIAKELGVSNLNQKLIYLLQTEIQNEASMPDIYYDNIVDEIGSIPYPREEDGESGNLFGEKKLRFIEALNIESSMVKSGKFGPEVDDFTMLLPTYYPTKAGQAKYALHAPLARYEDRLAKVHIESLPTKLDQVYEPTIQDRMEKYYHKINKTEEKKYEEALYNLLQQEAKFRMIESNTYIATRRKTYFKLPGLNKHYPNPHYVVPAVIPRHIDFQRLEETKMSVFDKLFGKQVIKSTTVPPAGRKPPANEMYEIQVALFKSKSEKSKLKASSEVDNVQSAEEKEKVKQKLRLKMKKSKKKKSKVKMYRVETDGYPPDFFPGRRSYFPVAPGLEDFIDEPGKVPKNAKKVKVYSSKKITAMDADALMRPSDHNDHIDMHDDDSSHSQAVGLIRRFTVNVSIQCCRHLNLIVNLLCFRFCVGF